MKVFLSWSGDLSHKVALILRDWLPSVIQSVEPYVSSEDIDKGARWSTDIAKELEASACGILCVTRDNIDAPWLNFEAGALSKTIDKSRVSPFLFALKRSEVKPGPILQFQSTIVEKDDVRKLLLSINGASQPALDEARLNKVFDVWWPELESKLKALEEDAGKEAATVSVEKADVNKGDILEELLELVRQQNRVINDPTTLLPPGYLSSVVDRSERFDRHPVFSDMADAWIALREQVKRAREKEAPPSEAIFRAIDRLSEPLEYIIDRFGRRSIRRGRVRQDPLDFISDEEVK